MFIVSGVAPEFSEKKKKALLMRKAVKRRHPHNFGQSTGVEVTLGDERAISDVEV